MLIVQPWMPGFKPMQAVISKAPIWVSLPELPIEFHSMLILQKIATEIGSFIKTDMKAIEQNRVRFARIQVLLDLAKQRKEVICLGGFKQNIQYEEIPQFCRTCNSIGHGIEICPHKPVVREETMDDGEAKIISNTNKIGQYVAESQMMNDDGEPGNPCIHVSRNVTLEKKKTNKKGSRNKKAETKNRAGEKQDEKGKKGQIRKGQNKKLNGSMGKHTVLVQKVTTRLSAQLRKTDQDKAQSSKPNEGVCQPNPSPIKEF